MRLAKEGFTEEDPWRIFRIMSEFVEGFEEMADVKEAVSIFGSAKLKPSNIYYKLAEITAAKLVKSGYAVITGAGPGIMEAANKGAKGAGGESIGLNILMPITQKPNRYITRMIEFKYFFCRKVMFAKYSKAFIVFPGGYGTLDELFEALALVQTGRLEAFPVILVGSKYWKGLLEWMKNALLHHKAINKSDLEIFTVVDKPNEVIATINRFYRRQ